MKPMRLEPAAMCILFNQHVQEVFHVYLNKFEIAVSHSFLIIFSDNKFTLLIRSSEMRSHQENISKLYSLD